MIVLIVLVVMAAMVIVVAMVIVIIVVVMFTMAIVVVMVIMAIVVAMVVVILVMLRDYQRMRQMLCMNLHVTSLRFIIRKHDFLERAVRHVLAKVCYQYRAVVQCDLSRGHCMGLDGDWRIAA